MELEQSLLDTFSFSPVESIRTIPSHVAAKLDLKDSLVRLHSSDTPVAAVEDSSAEMRLNFRTYFQLIKDDFKKQALFPFYLHGKDWLKLGAYAAVSSAVALINEPVKEYAVKLRANNNSIANVSKYVTRFGDPYIKYVLGGMFALGAVGKDRKFTNTTLLATQAYFISNVLGGAVKVLTQLQGPFYRDPFTGKIEPSFKGPFYTFKKAPDGSKLSINNYGSFPSGHTYSAFAIATVFAMQYSDKPVIPIFCYTLAGLVGLSRLTENRHWAIDIIPGALLGYYSGKQVVNNYRKFARSKAGPNKDPKQLSFNIQYNRGQFVPGILYRF